MKRFLAIVLALCMLSGLALSMTACGSSSDEEDVDPKIEAAAESLLGMQPVLTTIGIYSELYDSEYDPQDSSCFWKLIWILVNVYGTNNEDIVFDLEGIIVPETIAEEYAQALFADYNGLLPLPEGTTITYDAAQKAYILPWSDAWIINTEYTKIDQSGDDYIIDAELVDMSDEEQPQTLKQMRFKLAPNKAAQEKEGAIFLFGVKSVQTL